jgi:hypothetical protein
MDRGVQDYAEPIPVGLPEAQKLLLGSLRFASWYSQSILCLSSVARLAGC